MALPLLDVSVDPADFTPTPGSVLGPGLVQWKACRSVTLCKDGEPRGSPTTIKQKDGQMLVGAGYVILFVGDGGSFKG